jgi:tRNA nucleotidyltransferase/poly(A) polymerase
VQDEAPRLPPRARDAIARLAAAGIRAYVVGGAVRDALVGRAVRDFDLLVESALEDAARALPEAIEIDAQAARVLLLPERGDEPRVEIARPRGAATNLAEDLALRDFSVNAIAWDPSAQAFVDPLGGRADLRAKALRAPDPGRALVDDPLRILRGVRLERELGLAADDATERAFERAAPMLASAPGERVRDELWRLLALPEPSRAIERLRALGALAAVLPELLRLVGVAQNRFHADDVYHHTIAVCDLVAPDPLLRLAALLHDAAKPETKLWRAKPGDFTFHRHDHAADPHVRRVAARLRLSRRDARRLAALVRHHLLFPEQLRTRASLRRLQTRVGPDLLPDLLELRRADLASREASRRAPAAWNELIARLRPLEGGSTGTRAPKLALSGRDVMERLQLPAGPEVGRWLARLRRRVLEHPEENRRERLLDWLGEAAHRD